MTTRSVHTQQRTGEKTAARRCSGMKTLVAGSALEATMQDSASSLGR
jgi:hypothetical protein